LFTIVVFVVWTGMVLMSVIVFTRGEVEWAEVAVIVCLLWSAVGLIESLLFFQHYMDM
jgi:hypothetical protein